jgi:hypothetical protein
MTFDPKALSDRFDEKSKKAEADQIPTIDTITEIFASKFDYNDFEFAAYAKELSITAKKTGESIQVSDLGDGTFCVNHNNHELFNKQTIEETADDLADFHGKHKGPDKAPAAPRRAPQFSNSSTNHPQWGDH